MWPFMKCQVNLIQILIFPIFSPSDPKSVKNVDLANQTILLAAQHKFIWKEYI